MPESEPTVQSETNSGARHLSVPFTRSTSLVLSPTVVATILAASSFVLYLGTAWFEFVYDDLHQVLDNPSIRSWRYFWSYFSTPIMATPYYRPIFSVWFRLNYVLFGEHPAGWHVASVAVHSIAVVMIYLVARKLSGSSKIGVVAATIFAVHPVHIENVAWVSGVCDPLMAVFFCSALLSYLNSREGRNRPGWTALAVVFYALALLSKEPAVTFGLVVAAHAFIYSEGSWRRRFFDSVCGAAPFVALVVPYLWIRHIAVPHLAPTLNPIGWRTLVLTQPSLVWFYFKELVWPVNLSIFHDLGAVETPSFANFFLPGTLLLCAAIAFVWWVRVSRRHSRLLVFAVACVIFVLLPALYIKSFVPDETVHDRYLYLPSAGFAILAAVAYEQTLARVASEVGRRLIAGTALAVALVFGALNLSQQVYWANDLALYTRGFKLAPHNPIAIGTLARALADRGDYSAAAPMFEEILRRNPDDWLAQYNLGFIDYRVGRYPEAEQHLLRSVQEYNSDSFSFLYLGLTYMREGRLDEAERAIRLAIAIRGDRVGHHLALSFLLEEKGDRAGALNEARAEMTVSATELAVQRVAGLEKQP